MSTRRKTIKAKANARTHVIRKAKQKEVKQATFEHIQKQGFNVHRSKVHLHIRGRYLPYIWKESGGYTRPARGFSKLNTFQRTSLLEALDNGNLVAVRNPDADDHLSISPSPSIQQEGFQEEDDGNDEEVKKEESEDDETIAESGSVFASPDSSSIDGQTNTAQGSRSRSLSSSPSPLSSPDATPTPSAVFTRPTRSAPSPVINNNATSASRIVAALQGNQHPPQAPIATGSPSRTAQIAEQTRPDSSTTKHKADASTDNDPELFLRTEYKRRLREEMVETLADRTVDLKESKRKREELREWFEDGLRMLKEADGV
ncbi:hypothetical protein BJ508DRAFT_419029 [Ascobolus immersus RN42]|uniref:Uncharacterized protein n=1 Tax=Ascobolus immersus RN42 TaxID=1160509 RepID=A0A3N4HLR3_ASCIM|nr:hypothetical protein BJ508DRAFT_419029 [Ascobolus immersus RN42]